MVCPNGNRGIRCKVLRTTDPVDATAICALRPAAEMESVTMHRFKGKGKTFELDRQGKRTS